MVVQSMALGMVQGGDSRVMRASYEVGADLKTHTEERNVFVYPGRVAALYLSLKFFLKV